MYGLASRESLSKRQSRWVREVDEAVRSNPAQHAFTRETPANPIRDKPGIISMMTEPADIIPNVTDSSYGIETSGNKDSSNSLSSGQNPNLRKKTVATTRPFNSHMMSVIPDNSSDELSAVQAMYDEIRGRCTKLEREYESMRQSIRDRSELVSRVQKLEDSVKVASELSGRVQKLEQTGDVSSRLTSFERNADVSSLANRVSILERSISELSTRSIIDGSVKTPITFARHSDNSSEFSALTEATVREFVPYIIKEDYAARDNITKLDGLQFEMVVEILGFYSETPIIYPFGTEKSLPRLAEMTLNLSFRDADNEVDGMAYGVFKRRSDGVYTIRLTELYSDGNASGIEQYTLPLTLQCKTKLILE